MAKVDIWMPIYIGSYLADTLHLNTEQHGAYLLLLMYGWTTGGKIPANESSLMSISKLTQEAWERNRQVIRGFFEEVDGYWIQKRQLEELEKANNRRDSAKLNGNQGGRPRKNPEITGGLFEGIPDGNPNHNPRESSLSLSLSSQDLKSFLSIPMPSAGDQESLPEPPKAPAPPPPPAPDPQFEAARKAFPGDKRGHELEWSNFLKSIKKLGKTKAEVLPLLLPAINAEKLHKFRLQREKKFCPEWAMFSTWINQGRWTQELTQPPTGTPGPSAAGRVPYDPLRP